MQIVAGYDVDMPLALLSNLDGYLSYPMQPNETDMGETILVLLSISIANFVSKCIMSPFCLQMPCQLWKLKPLPPSRCLPSV
jgi:hypothetical protein